jgi:hypothetical protein
LAAGGLNDTFWSMLTPNLTSIPQDQSELQLRLDRERDSQVMILFSNSELWQPPFCMQELFVIIPGCDYEPIRMDFAGAAH